MHSVIHLLQLKLIVKQKILIITSSLHQTQSGPPVMQAEHDESKTLHGFEFPV